MKIICKISQNLLRSIFCCGVGFVFSVSLSAQNLIANPSFEDFATNEPTRNLDTSLVHFPNILNWRSPTWDRLGSIRGPFYIGFTQITPNSGYHLIVFNPGLNYQSPSGVKIFVQSELIDSLKSNCYYKFSIYHRPQHYLALSGSLAQAKSSFCVSNRLGAYFSANPIQDTSGISLPHHELKQRKGIRLFDNHNIIPQVQIRTDTFFDDTTKYSYFEQEFIAQGGEKYITIGNFFPIEQTLYKNLTTDIVFSTHIDDTLPRNVQNNAWQIDDLTLELIPQPNQAFTHSPDTNICPGESIELFARLEVPGNYLWSTGDTTPTISVTEAGVYSVTASCPCGLEYSAEITVEALNPLPNINVNDTNICENIGHILINLPPEVDYYLNGEKQSNSIMISAEGSYALIAKNQCEEKSFDFNVGVIPCDFTMYIPNAFTPNNDGRNDCYRIAASNIYHFHIRIFNRWGQEVFASTDPNFCWDGALNGSPLPQGVYTCRISFSDNELVPPQHVLRNIILIR